MLTRDFLWTLNLFSSMNLSGWVSWGSRFYYIDFNYISLFYGKISNNVSLKSENLGCRKGLIQ